jgi:hypothetical protein
MLHNMLYTMLHYMICNMLTFMCCQAGHQIWKLIWQMHRTMTVLMYSVQLLNLRQIRMMEYLVSWALDIRPCTMRYNVL